MYFHAKRTELPWGGFRFQKTFRGYNVQAKPQYDGVAAVAATILRFINGSEREELHLLMLCIAETPARMCSLGFHFLRMFRCERAENSCRKPLKVTEMRDLLYSLLYKENWKGAWCEETLRGRKYQAIQNCLIWWISDAKQNLYQEAEMRQM